MINLYLLTTILLLGTAIGSFINVVVDRLPKGKSLNGRSHCDFCRKKLGALDLIPVLSFLFLRGRCRYCHKKLSWQYPIVEFLTGALFIIIYYLLIINKIHNSSLIIYNSYLLGSSNFGFSNLYPILYTLYFILLFSLLWSIFLMDLKYMIIADELQIVLGLASIPLFLKDPVNHIIGALVLSVIFYGIYRITKRKGMGFGDVKLTFVMGLLLGWHEGLIAVYLSFILGGMVGIVLLALKKKGMKSKVAFGPFLVIGTAIMLLFPDQITRLISGWFGII